MGRAPDHERRCMPPCNARAAATADGASEKTANNPSPMSRWSTHLGDSTKGAHNSRNARMASAVGSGACSHDRVDPTMSTIRNDSKASQAAPSTETTISITSPSPDGDSGPLMPGRSCLDRTCQPIGGQFPRVADTGSIKTRRGLWRQRLRIVSCGRWVAVRLGDAIERFGAGGGGRDLGGHSVRGMRASPGWYPGDDRAVSGLFELTAAMACGCRLSATSGSVTRRSSPLVVETVDPGAQPSDRGRRSG